MKILAVGGAGYIGSHTVWALRREGYDVVVFDNLSSGHKEALPEGVPLLVGDLNDRKKLDEVFQQGSFDAVMHFAAFIEAGESVLDPSRFYRNNVSNTLNLLDAMRTHQVSALVFSSSAAVYGDPKDSPVTENSETKPINAYGRTKLMIEQVLSDYDAAYELRSICLRYFNAAGAGFGIGPDHKHKTHLITLLMEVASGRQDHIKVFGTGYPTDDGTCIRDFIHVNDIADAGIKALAYLAQTGKSDVFTLGNGEGFSVREVIETTRDITGMPTPSVDCAKRRGDPPKLIADSTKAKQVLGWSAKHNIRSIIRSAWEWHKERPDGFN